MSGAATVLGAVVLTAATLAAGAGASPAAAAPPVPLPVPPLPVVQRAETKVISTLIGTGTAGDTGRRFGVEGTDLGHTFLHKGRLAALFGDTYGSPPADPFFSVRHTDWRSNTMGWLDPERDAAGSTRLESMISDRPGHAKELLGSKKRRGVEETVIPTAGISTGDRMWLHYMSVKSFDKPGRWTLNSAGVAHSDDDGQTWVKDPGAVWSGGSRFGQVAYVRPAEDPDDGEADGDPDGFPLVYVYGVPGGRYGSVSLARVPANRVGDKAAYSYRTASGGWSPDESAAATVVPGPVGELSVRYHAFYHRWLMMYLVDPTGEIVLRSSDSPTGPWSDAQVVASTKQFPQAYAPYLTPVWNDGPDVVFTMSRYDNYRVALMRTRLGFQSPDAALPPDVRQTPPGLSLPQLPFVPYPFGHGGTG
jgi:hypothetical protein